MLRLDKYQQKATLVTDITFVYNFIDLLKIFTFISFKEFYIIPLLCLFPGLSLVLKSWDGGP